MNQKCHCDSATLPRLPFDPTCTLLKPDAELIVEYQRISEQWLVYVQKMQRLILEQPAKPPIKKNCPPLPSHIKSAIFQALQDNKAPGLIALEVGVLPQTVYDQKYSLVKAGRLASTRRKPVLLG